MWKAMLLVGKRSCDLAISVKFKRGCREQKRLSFTLNSTFIIQRDIVQSIHHRQSKMAEKIEKLIASADQDTERRLPHSQGIAS
jgi:hypothetical protein